MRVVLVVATLLFTQLAAAGTSFEITEFIDLRDGKHAELVVICKDGKPVRVRFERTKLNRINIERLYDIIDGECNE